MTTQELIESGMLAGLGLLDDDEQTAYEHAMADAPLAVREYVQAEQRRMADLGELAPDVEPRDELRELVLAAVRAAMATEQPRRHADARRNPPAMPRLSRRTRVNSLWRAGAIGLAAATVTLAIVNLQTNTIYKNAGQDVLLTDLYDRIGADLFNDVIFEEQTARVALTPVAGQSRARAAVFHNPDWSSARLFVNNLRSAGGEQFRLVVLDTDGNVVREVAAFESRGDLDNIEVSVEIRDDTQFAVYRSNVGADIDAAELVLKGQLQG